jgi:hypothetical protein
MEYWKVRWHHDFTEEPVTIWNEIGFDGYEVRKIQEFRDGRLLKADEQHETGEIGLSEVPVGDLNEVAAQSDFSAVAITSKEFEIEWTRASWS